MNESAPSDKSLILRDYAGQLIQESSTVHSNVDQDIVIVTEDKIRLCLMEHLKRIERKNSWIAPLGILLTIIIVFPTTDFQDFLSVSAETWNACFIIAAILTTIWLIRAVISARVSTSLDDVVSNIKKSSI